VSLQTKMTILCTYSLFFFNNKQQISPFVLVYTCPSVAQFSLNGKAPDSLSQSQVFEPLRKWQTFFLMILTLVEFLSLQCLKAPYSVICNLRICECTNSSMFCSAKISAEKECLTTELYCLSM